MHISQIKWYHYRYITKFSQIYWLASGLTGLVDDIESEIHVRLTVNGEVKTTDGTDNELVLDGDGDPALDANGDTIPNKYGSFTVTPGSM